MSDLLKNLTTKEFCEAYTIATDEVARAITDLSKAKHRLSSFIDRFEVLPRSMSDFELSEPDRVIGKCREHMHRTAWRELIQRSNVRSVMVEARQRELDTELTAGKLPPITPEAVEAWVSNLRGDLPRLIDEAIAEASRVLRPQDRAYATNGDGWRLGEKAIIEYAVIWDNHFGFQLQYTRQAVLGSIDNAFHLLDGKGPAKHPNTLACVIQSAMRIGAQVCETTYYRLKFFKNGNLHFTFLRPDLVDALNARTGNRSLRDQAAAKKTDPRAKHRTAPPKEHADLNFYATPPELAARLVELADLKSLPSRSRVLEPSAGSGAILSAICKAISSDVLIAAIEIDSARACQIQSEFGSRVNVACMDFTEYAPARKFQRIIANPPFSGGRDVQHVNLMIDLLAPGGRLVSVVSAGITYRSDRATVDLRNKIELMGGVITPLPAGSFSDSGTEVSTCVVTVDNGIVK